MSNHLEDLTAEWLKLNGHFVRKSVLVGKRPNGHFVGELDVVGLHPVTEHLIHIEWSLDADPWAKREVRFTSKFERGRRFIKPLFAGLHIDAQPEQIALLQFGGGERTRIGGARIVWVSDLIADIISALKSRSPDKKAVPSTLPLMRTMQLASQPPKKRKREGSLIPATVASELAL